MDNINNSVSQNSNLPEKITEMTYDKYGNFKQMKSDYLSIPRFRYESEPENEDEKNRRSDYEEKFDSFILNLCLADAKRDEKSYTELKNEFLKVLRRCKTEEDLRNLRESLQKLGNIGGYATIFYEDNKKTISDWNEIREYIRNNKQRKYSPVSEMDKENNSIKSKYYNISPSQIIKGSNYKANKRFEFDLYFIIAAIAREDAKKCVVGAKDIVSMIAKRHKSNDEQIVIANTLKILASQGGYARDFYENIEEELAQLDPSILNSLIEKVKDPSFNTIQNNKYPIKEITPEETNNIDSLRSELSTNIEKLSMELEDYYKKGIIREDELEKYLRKCHSFEEILDKNKDSFGDSFYEEYSEQISRMRISLNRSLELMKEEKKVWSSVY